MAGKGKKWLIGCGVGCGFIILLNIILFLGAGFMISQPMNKAVNSQKALVEAYGTQSQYVPGVDSITGDRIETFLKVRSALMPFCDEFEELAGGFAAMDELDNSEDGPEAMEVIKGLGRVMGSVKGMVTEMGKVMEVRNTVLLDQGMGLGEYTWIYILAYNSWLGHTPNMGIDSDEGQYSGREKSVLAQMMNGHAEALASSGRMDEAEIWKAEAKKLDWSESGVPFSAGGLPPEIAGILEPFHTRLEESFCAPLSDIDLNQIKKKGLSFHTN